MNVGMIAEVTCVSKPFAIIPTVVTDLQRYIAAGQFRGGEQLLEPKQVTQPGTLYPPQCPPNTRLLKGSNSAWIRNSTACTSASPSTA